MNCEHYKYRVLWSENDQEHVALRAEFPSLSFWAPKPAQAIKGLVDLVGDTVADLQNTGEDIPCPLCVEASFRRHSARKRCFAKEF